VPLILWLSSWTVLSRHRFAVGCQTGSHDKKRSGRSHSTPLDWLLELVLAIDSKKGRFDKTRLDVIV